MKRQNRIYMCLESVFPNAWIEVHNESDMHRGPVGRETHYKVVVVSDRFQGCSKVVRHRMVYGALKAEWDAGLHALSLVLYTPKEYQEHGSVIPKTPRCVGK